MVALNFPDAPVAGDKYPFPSQVGIPTYTFDGEKWTTVGGDVGTLLPATATPLMDGTAAVGTSAKYAREDHVHPTDSKIALATAAEYLANSAQTKQLTSKTVWDAAVAVAITDATSVAPNLALGSDFVWTAGAAGRTLANPVGGKQGQKGVIVLINSGNVTGWGSAYKFPNALKPTLSGTSLISYMVAADGTTMYCTALTAMG